MSDHKRNKRARSRSRGERHSKRRSDEKFDQLQKQLDNLTKVVGSLAEVHKDRNTPHLPSKDLIDVENEENNSNLNNVDEELIFPSELETSKSGVLEILGIDPNDSKFKEVKYLPELKDTWQKWKKEGLPEKKKNQILELYNRKGEFYTEAPKLNLEINPLLSDVTKRRDQHFIETQNCVGTAIAALGAAVSMIIEPPEDGLDESILTDYISHAGQMLTDVFYQQSVTRKSFITPHLNKSVKPLVDTMLSDEWLYGDDLRDKVKDVKEIEKACASIKERPPRKILPKVREQGNWKYPPAGFRQVGQQQRRRQIKFKPRTYKTSQGAAKASPQTTNQSSSRN